PSTFRHLRPVSTSSSSSPIGSPALKRILTLSDLVVYGIIVIQVVAPIPIFGLIERRSNGHSVVTVLAAMLVMLITALTYGRMASLYPSAGSAYTYVSRAIHPHLGFLVGSAMFLDYSMILVISALIPALAIQRLIPAFPLMGLTFLISLSMTALNLRGIRM